MPPSGRAVEEPDPRLARKGPVAEGDSLTTEIWTGDELGRDERGDGKALFRVVNQEGAVLVDRGHATLA